MHHCRLNGARKSYGFPSKLPLTMSDHRPVARRQCWHCAFLQTTDMPNLYILVFISGAVHMFLIWVMSWVSLFSSYRQVLQHHKPLGHYTYSVVIQQLVPSTISSTCLKNRQFYLLIGTQSVWKDTPYNLHSTKVFTKPPHNISIYNGDRQTEKQGQGEKINNDYAILLMVVIKIDKHLT